MRSGAAAGIAPRVWYTSVEDRISITDFVEARPFPVNEALVRLPSALKELHALPAFPRAVNYLDAVDGFIRKFQDAKILPESETRNSLNGTHGWRVSTRVAIHTNGVESQRFEA
jgi:hypothetical protein